MQPTASPRRMAPLSATVTMALALALGTGEARAQASVAWWDLDPLVVDAAAPVDVTLTVALAGEADEVRLDLAGGGSLVLAPAAGVWSATIPGAAAVAGYGSGEHDYNQAYHNLVGDLKVIAGGVEVVAYHVFAIVRDATVPAVTVAALAHGAQVSPHLLNLQIQDLDPAAPPFPEVIARAVDLLGDELDLFGVITLPQVFANRVQVRLQTPEQGIGEPVNDTAAAHGTLRGRGFTHFPVAAYFDAGSAGFVHEIGHQWIQWLDDVEALAGAKFHWPLSTLAQSVMGVSGPASQGWQGLQFPFQLVAAAEGGWKALAVPAWRTFHDLDLYLMGMIPADEVEAHVVFRRQEQPVAHGTVLAGDTTPVGVGDVVAAYGPRAPAYPDAPRAFTYATVVVSKERLLNPAEMATLDHLAARAAAEEALVCTGGMVATTDLPFRLATGGRGCLEPQLRFLAPRPEAPSTASSGATYQVTWSASSQAGAYQIQEATDAAFATASTWTVNGTSRPFVHSVPASAATYFYRVRAVDHCTGALRASPWSAPKQVTVAPRAAHTPHPKLTRRP